MQEYTKKLTSVVLTHWFWRNELSEWSSQEEIMKRIEKVVMNFYKDNISYMQLCEKIESVLKVGYEDWISVNSEESKISSMEDVFLVAFALFSLPKEKWDYTKQSPPISEVVYEKGATYSLVFRGRREPGFYFSESNEVSYINILKIAHDIFEEMGIERPWDSSHIRVDSASVEHPLVLYKNLDFDKVRSLSNKFFNSGWDVIIEREKQDE